MYQVSPRWQVRPTFELVPSFLRFLDFMVLIPLLILYPASKFVYLTIFDLMNRTCFGSTTTGTSWKALTIGSTAQDFEAHEDPVNGLAVSHDVCFVLVQILLNLTIVLLLHFISIGCQTDKNSAFSNGALRVT